ncbi:MAG: response regulator, partial [Spirochaetota bacterium]
GIPAEKQGRLFKPFMQADSSTTKKFGGTGLGLVISKKIVDKMQGTIWFESQSDVGTKFYFQIPLRIPNLPARLDYLNPEHAFLKGKVCLIIDDNSTNLKVFEYTLRFWQMQALCFVSPQQGIAELHKHLPDILILDYNMPEKTGIEIAEEIRSQYGEKVPILICSSYDFLEIQNQKIVYDEFLVKPVLQKKLYEVLCHLFQQKHEQIATKPKEIKKIQNAYHVLVAEDNPVNQQLVLRMFGKLGIEVTIADNGQIATDLCSNNDYDLIFMDIHMPIMNGFDAIYNIQNSGKQSPPIIIMSADVFFKEKNEDLQVTESILKPIKISDIERILDKYELT